MSEIQALDVRIPAEIINNWGWFLLFGICLVLLGAVAIVRSVAATVVSMLFFGWLLLIAAGIEIVQAVMVGKWAGLFQHWLSAALFGVLGALIVWRPVVTAEILTLLIGAFFLVAGIFQLVTPFVISLPEWGWHALNGLITLVLGVLILAQWPVSGLWVIGLFLGIELIFYGGAWIAVALRLRSARVRSTLYSWQRRFYDVGNEGTLASSEPVWLCVGGPMDRGRADGTSNAPPRARSRKVANHEVLAPGNPAWLAWPRNHRSGPCCVLRPARPQARPSSGGQVVK